MTIFVDASVMVAILNKEDDAPEQAARLGSADDPNVADRRLGSDGSGGQATLRRPCAGLQARPRLLSAVDVRVIVIGESEMRAALEAFADFGKGRHDAALNIGYCFAYACAKTNGARLLYKGDDFAKTDLA